MGVSRRWLLSVLLLIPPFTQAALVVAPYCAVEQLTHTTGVTNTWWPILDGSGTRVLFFSTLDLTGGNADRGMELFLLDTTTRRRRFQASSTAAAGATSC